MKLFVLLSLLFFFIFIGSTESILSLSFYDFVIVGSGAAGGIVADRLSAKGFTVLVLEAGGPSLGAFGGVDYVSSKGTYDPVTKVYTPNRPLTKYDVPFYFQSDSANGDKYDIQGTNLAKVIGGCGVHNAMVFMRGKTSDYDGWGVPGWDWNGIQPYFLKLETILDSHLTSSANHGHDGIIKVRSIPFDQEGADLISSCSASGLPFNNDFYDDSRDGCGYFQFNIDEKGERCSSAHTYLLRATKRSNVDLVTYASVSKIKWQYNFIKSKYEAVGVEYTKIGSQLTYTVTAFKEVILSAGAINTPKILMNSGIGDSSYLNSFPHVSVIKNSPGVGKNLQNHFISFNIWTYNKVNSRPDFYQTYSSTFEYQTSGTGIFATPGFSAGAFLRANESSTEGESIMTIFPGILGGTSPIPSMTLAISIAHPTKHPFQQVKLNPDTSGTFSEFYKRPPIVQYDPTLVDEDMEILVRGIKESRRIMSYPPMSNYAAPVFPPAAISSDQDLKDFVKQNIQLHDHWCGTAKMGPSSDPTSVVDSNLRVIGVDKLRVVDASVIPTIPNSLLHATVLAIAEKASDLILSDYI
ncbi:hypothetical protein CYY_005430 [Polysphondylium violaceum]|uniref:Glucose-methanol-choline oxidoreductase N-terminal domain-containing protein n=1 Tax=Polysphondylium violaceum TaxID=133409 RepID=A0A8J4PSY6_9MYCE|nr:hypothetical protein CYY_005430 [Polysphondylium violaceum]